MSFAIGMGAEELSIGLYCDKKDRPGVPYPVDPFGALTKGKYVFQLRNFEGSKANLKSLRLVGCLLGQYSPDQFRCLQTLTVACTNLAQYDLHGMFTCLLKLKSLTIERCTLPEKLSLNSLTQLENFMIVSCEGVKVVGVSNMNLVSIQSVRNNGFVFVLRAAPNLKHFRHLVRAIQLSFFLTQLQKHCPALQSLAISTFSNLVKYTSPIATANFCRVTKLCLIFGEGPPFDVVKMNSILRAFPCLKKLEFVLTLPDLEEGKAETNEYVHKHLKQVVFLGFRGTSDG
ncbi:hypothetical protein Tsubulata_039653 [Turnera subulata]|uniref:At1g61320/AtMIF1 LRR domain-containing protein n=1 Tax=Turnera subulata TaxID=218843 RepID=A0A9Q0JE02_9ROSI|nr:hypothetical protein Tsubulata_039653 [Turnera subulata]